MADRRLYGTRGFVVEEVVQYDAGQVWYLVGSFAQGAIRTKFPKDYRVRVEPDPRWKRVREVAFRSERIYESESVAYHSRRHIYGSGKWYISPYFAGSRYDAPGKFLFEDFDVLANK